MKIVILISGNGSNLQAVLDAINDESLFNCEIALVISDRKNAYGLQRAKNAHVPTQYIPFRKKEESREAYDDRLSTEIEKHNPSYILCLGFLHIFGKKFVNKFEGKLINLHPALPCTFTGLNCIEKQYKAMQEGKIAECGVMCHYVDFGIDTGKTIATRSIKCNTLENNISMEEFEQKIHDAEHETVIRTLKELCNSMC